MRVTRVPGSRIFQAEGRANAKPWMLDVHEEILGGQQDGKPVSKGMEMGSACRGVQGARGLAHIFPFVIFK